MRLSIFTRPGHRHQHREERRPWAQSCQLPLRHKSGTLQSWLSVCNMEENCEVIPRNYALRVLLELVDDNCTDLGWVLALLVGEAASNLECLSTSHDAFDCAHNLRVLPTAFVMLDDPGLRIVKSLPRTSIIAVVEERRKY